MITLALQNFQDQNRELPNGTVIPRGSPVGENTKFQRFSWRVQLLPFMGEKDLYDKFDLTQPWDSEHNLKVAQEMPDIYRSPLDEKGTNHTSYLAIAEGGGAFPVPDEDGGRRSISDATDGPGATIAIVECQNTGIIWTDPRDLSVDEFAELVEKGKIASGTELRGDHTWVGMLDGVVRRYPKGVAAAVSKILATRNAGEVPPEKFPGS
jgi:hypothetical protein